MGNGGKPGAPARGAAALAQPPRIGFAESDQIDFKEQWSGEAVENLASFANARGGTVYVGVADDGRLLGADVSDAQQQRIAGQVRSLLQIAADVRVERHHGVDILAVRVPPSAQPVLLRGSYWVRSGTTSSKAPTERWTGLVLGQMGKSWDAQPGGTMDDIDPEAVRRFVREAKATANPRLPPDVPDDAPADVVLTTLRLVGEGGRVTNAAVLLFGRDPQRTLPSARVRVARFRSNDEIIDHAPAGGTIFEQVDSAARAVDEHNPSRMVVTGGAHAGAGPAGGSVARREESRQYPPLAIREAIVNAVVHRDYLAPGDVQVRILDDRIEVWSPGGLPSGLTAADLLKRPHPSIPRNGLIAGAAYMARLSEGWGTGTTRMRDRCREAGLPDPVFAEAPGGFSVTIAADALTPEAIEALGLNDRQRAGIARLKERQRITSAEYQALTGAPRTTAIRDFAALVEAGIVERRGSGRGAYYVLAAGAAPG